MQRSRAAWFRKLGLEKMETDGGQGSGSRTLRGLDFGGVNGIFSVFSG